MYRAEVNIKRQQLWEDVDRLNRHPAGERKTMVDVERSVRWMWQLRYDEWKGCVPTQSVGSGSQAEYILSMNANKESKGWWLILRCRLY